jgi:hypothetical protein
MKVTSKFPEFKLAMNVINNQKSGCSFNDIFSESSLEESKYKIMPKENKSKIFYRFFNKQKDRFKRKILGANGRPQKI